MKKHLTTQTIFWVLSLAIGIRAQQVDQPEVEPPPTASLAIRVVAEGSGEPVADAKVQVVGGQAGGTDPDGICFLDGLLVGRARVAVSKEGFATAYQYVNLNPDEEASLTIALDPGGKIVGMVTNQFGEILPDAVCSLFSEEGRVERETADENALFTLDGLSRKRAYTLHISHPDYCSKSLRDVKIPEDTGVLTLEIALDAGGYVKGRVTDEQGRPVQGAKVSAGGPRGDAETDAEGVYVLQRLDLQRTWLRVAAPGCAPDKREVVPKVEGTSADFRLLPGRRLAGRVLAEDGKPLPGVSVRAYANYFGWIGDILTDGEGRFRLDSLPDDRVWVYFRLDGHSDPRLWLKPGDENLTVTLYRLGHILGRVADKEGNPVPEFRLFLSPAPVQGDDRQPNMPSQFPAQTGVLVGSPKGEFEIPTVTVKGPYRLSVVTRDHAPTTLSRVIGAPQDSEERILVTVEKGRVLDGKVVNGTTGQPIAGAEIILSVQNISLSDWQRSRYGYSGWGQLPAETLTCSSGEDGGFHLSNVAPQSYYVMVRHPDYAELPTERISFSPSQKQPERTTGYMAVPPATEAGVEGVVFRLNKGASLSGHCYDKDGKPAVGARVILSGTRFATTDEQGAYRFEKVLPGSFYVTFFASPSGSSKWGGAYWTEHVTVKAEQEAVLDFRPVAGLTLTGQVVSDRRTPRSVRVRVQPLKAASPIFTVETDGKGRFEVGGIKPGQYWVSVVSRQGRDATPLATKSVSVVEGQPATVTIEVEKWKEGGDDRK